MVKGEHMYYKQPHGNGGRFFKKAVIYTFAAAVGTWLAFQPLVSSAQMKKIPRQKPATAKPMLASTSKENTIPFSDALARTNAVQVKYDSMSQYEGVKRIMIELAGRPEQARFQSQRYAALVDSISSILTDSLKLAPSEQEKILVEVGRILQIRFNFSDADTTMWASLDKSTLNCERAAMLAYDVLWKTGVFVEIVYLESKYQITIKGTVYDKTIGHTLVKTGDFVLETTNGEVYPRSGLLLRFRIIYDVGTNPQYNTFITLGNCLARQEKYDSAIILYQKATDLAPNVPYSIYNSAFLYSKLGEFEKAIAAYDRVLAIDPLFDNGIVVFARGIQISIYISKYHRLYPKQE